MSRRGKAATCRRSPNFSDTNWVKLGSFSFFEKVEIGEIVNV
jgi:hypothetical protein